MRMPGKILPCIGWLAIGVWVAWVDCLTITQIIPFWIGVGLVDIMSWYDGKYIDGKGR